jgi:hypothetical protein
MFFWVFPRRQIMFCRCFGTLCQVHFQRLDVEYEVRGERDIYIYNVRVCSRWQGQWGEGGIRYWVIQSGWVGVEGEV